MTQNSIRQNGLDASEQYVASWNYVIGANIAGFIKLMETMLDQGVV